MTKRAWDKTKVNLLSAQQVSDAVGLTLRGVQYNADKAIAAGVAVRVGKVVVYHVSAVNWFKDR